MPPRVLVLRAPGTNCDRETALAFERAGAVADRLHVNRVLESPALTSTYQVFCIPGGFSYGDDIAAGRILANQIGLHLAEQMQLFRDSGKLILGICNGFQVLLKSGVLLVEGPEGPQATLTWNDSGRFEDRWVRLRFRRERSVFLAGIDQMELPVAHAEGKFVARDERVLGGLDAEGQLVARYRSWRGDPRQPVAYPDNPNGSQADVAAVSDTTGRVLGMMPHPERFLESTQHPCWTRRQQGEAGDGLRLFQNAVNYFL